MVPRISIHHHMGLSKLQDLVSGPTLPMFNWWSTLGHWGSEASGAVASRLPLGYHNPFDLQPAGPLLRRCCSSHEVCSQAPPDSETEKMLLNRCATTYCTGVLCWKPKKFSPFRLTILSTQDVSSRIPRLKITQQQHLHKNSTLLLMPHDFMTRPIWRKFTFLLPVKIFATHPKRHVKPLWHVCQDTLKAGTDGDIVASHIRLLPRHLPRQSSRSSLWFQIPSICSLVSYDSYMCNLRHLLVLHTWLRLSSDVSSTKAWQVATQRRQWITCTRWKSSCRGSTRFYHSYYTCVHIYAYVSKYIHMSTCDIRYTCMYIRVYIYSHMHIHITLHPWCPNEK